MPRTTLFAMGKPPRPTNRRTLLPVPWRRIDNGVGKIGAMYQDGRGYTIQQCGHPTALWPYALYGPDGYMIIAPNGRAWQKAIYAALEVDRRLKAVR